MAITDQTFTPIIDAGGRASISFRPPTSRSNYIVQQVSVEYAAAPIGCTCDVRKNGRLISPLIPTGDAAAGDPPVPIGGGSDILTVNFANGTPGDLVSIYIIFDDGT